MLRSVVAEPARFKRWVDKAAKLWGEGGWDGVRKYLRVRLHGRDAERLYQEWVRRHDTLGDDDRRQIREHAKRLSYQPLISIVMPVYNAEEVWLRRAIESVRAQLYERWELCIADDCSVAPHVRHVLEEYNRLGDARIKVTFRDRNGHISAASNSALTLVSGEFVALMDHDDELSEHALYMVAERLDRNPALDLLYSDEDHLDARGGRVAPHFKSAWNPDLFRSLNLISHLGVYRAELVRSAGGFREGYEGSQDYDLALRVIERTAPERIAHIPFVLYHWRETPASESVNVGVKSYARGAALRALGDHLERTSVPATAGAGLAGTNRVVYRLPAPAPSVSLIIATRDRVKLLRQTINDIIYRTDYPTPEIIVVDNRSEDRATLEYLDDLRERSEKIRVLEYDAPFNFSAINNYAAREARGEIIGLLNNDLKVISPGWLREMVSQAARPEVGAVGAKLYYENDTVQHGGIILGLGATAAGHAHKTFPRESCGYVKRACAVQNLSAVTGACLVLRREVFERAGGMNEELPIAFNDVDLCLRIRRLGLLIVWTPYAELYHLESASRGTDASGENLARLRTETRYMIEKWGAVIGDDPYYNPNLTLDEEDLTVTDRPRVVKPWKV